MFLSTVIPSTNLDVDHLATGATINKFSVPYNFVRGRNIVVNINPAVSNNGHVLNTSGLMTRRFEPGVGEKQNCYFFTIPDNIDVHTTTVDIRAVILYSNGTASTNGVYNFNVQITFDTVNNIITFLPLSKNVVSGTDWTFFDTRYCVPVLLTIETIL